MEIDPINFQGTCRKCHFPGRHEMSGGEASMNMDDVKDWDILKLYREEDVELDVFVEQSQYP